MRNLLLFLAKYGHFILFLVLELICFLLIINFNSSQKDIWAHSLSLHTGNVKERISNLNGYLNLQNSNDSLHAENAKLLQEIVNFKVYTKDNLYQEYDVKDTLPYNIIPARICDKSIHLRNNHFTLCKGSSHGISKGMGVISSNGIIGLVKSVSDNYSDIIIILNSLSRTSVVVKNKEYFGNLLWKSNNPKKMALETIPKYAKIEIGDTIVTSGYSIAFPPNLPVGRIQSFEPNPAGNDFKIDVQLFNDFETIEYVYVVDLKTKVEKEEVHSIEESK